MDSSTIHSWQSPYHPVHASTPAQDWQKQASPRGAQTEVATQIARSPALDLSDFTPSNPPASPLSAQSSSFYPLNGATTSSAASATQQQPSESLQMVIDPALTTMNGSTSNERRQQMLTAIRPLLQANAFTGPSAVATLAIRLLNYGSLDVDAATRMEILTKIRDGAGNHYFCTWAENPTAVDITREWLKAAFAASHEDGGDAQLVETIMPLLHLIDRLPMTVESLKASKLGKVVVKLVKDPPTPAIKDMASNIERRWRQMVVDEVPNSVADDPKSKKRKIADPPVRALPPRKKTAVGAVPAKEPAASSKTAAPVKDAKSDSSFFSAPKLKPKLPSFKKAPPAPAKKDDVAQPSAIDPFQEALKTRKGSPLAAIVSTPSPERSGSTSARGSHLLSPVLTEMESVHPASYIPRHIVNCGLNLARKMEDQTLESLVEERVAQLQAISQRRNALLRQMFHMVQNRQNLASVIKLQDEEGDEELAVFLDKFDLTKNPDTGSIDYFVQDHLVVSTPSLGQLQHQQRQPYGDWPGLDQFCADYSQADVDTVLWSAPAIPELCSSFQEVHTIHRGPWFEIHRNFISYASHCYDGSWDDVGQLSKQWAQWDTLASLAHHRFVVQALFVHLTKSSNFDLASATKISSCLSEDVSCVLRQMNSILSDRATYKHFLSCRGAIAQQLLDLLQDLLDSSHELTSRALFSKALLRLSGECGLHPTCFTLTGVQKMGQQVAGGGFGDIWKGLVGGQTVAVKSMRQFADDDVKASLKKLGYEALIWRQLSHPNLLPFFGLYMLDHRLSLISPWMENGDLKRFLSSAPPDIDRVSLIADVAMGLEYLHSENVVHGDLKTPNILVTPSGRACITDFGLSTIVDELSLKLTFSSRGGRGGTIRYQAPELLKNESPNHYGSDVYAFACVSYEVLTGKVPFFELTNNATIICKVVYEEVRPSRLQVITPDLWLLLEDCWHQQIGKRPSATAILRRLSKRPTGREIKESPPDWDDSYSARFRRSVQEWPLLPSVGEVERRILSRQQP